MTGPLWKERHRLAALAWGLAALVSAPIVALLPRSTWSQLFLPFQAALHEPFLPWNLLLVAALMLALARGWLGRAWLVVGLVSCAAGLAEVGLRVVLSHSLPPMAAVSLLLTSVVGLGLASGYHKVRRVQWPGWFSSFFVGSYLLVAGAFYPVAHVYSRLTAQHTPLAELTPAGPFDRHGLELEGRRLQAFYGELHGHSYLSIDAQYNGASGPEDYYVYARDIAGLDFAALTEHDTPNGIGDNPELWAYVCELADRFDEPGRFVTFKAFEWTSGEGHKELFRHVWGDPRSQFLDDPSVWGHRNVFFPPGAEVPEVLFHHSDPASDTPEELWTFLERYGAIGIPHHPLGGPVPAFKWEHYDDEGLEPLVELYSAHGSSEVEGGPLEIYNAYRKDEVGTSHSVHDALGMGYHFAVIGSTDTHTGWGGNGTTRPDASRPEKMTEFLRRLHGGAPVSGGGLAGVYATELTREGIWEAFVQKRTFATTGARMAVALEAGGAFMGQRVVAEAPVQVRAEVVGTAPVTKLELIRDGEIVLTLQPNSLSPTLEWVDEDPLEAERWYLLRVTQEDGEMAWSSPVWVRPE